MVIPISKIHTGFWRLSMKKNVKYLINYYTDEIIIFGFIRLSKSIMKINVTCLTSLMWPLEIFQ